MLAFIVTFATLDYLLGQDRATALDIVVIYLFICLWIKKASNNTPANDNLTIISVGVICLTLKLVMAVVVHWFSKN
jgi:hypothetical protein